jgi:hypothetical protein
MARGRRRVPRRRGRPTKFNPTQVRALRRLVLMAIRVGAFSSISNASERLAVTHACSVPTMRKVILGDHPYS